MAKYERRFTGELDSVLARIDRDILGGSVTATLEDGSDIAIGGTRVAVRVYERYSAIGSNRVSLNITVAASGRELFLSAITSGGSQAVWFKVNTLGESSFLDRLVESVESIAAGR